jgi:hypothetical protein
MKDQAMSDTSTRKSELEENIRITLDNLKELSRGSDEFDEDELLEYLFDFRLELELINEED